MAEVEFEVEVVDVHVVEVVEEEVDQCQYVVLDLMLVMKYQEDHQEEVLVHHVVLEVEEVEAEAEAEEDL